MALIVPARTRLMLVGLRHTVILRSSLCNVLADVGSTCSLMFALGVQAITVYAIDGFICARTRCIYYLEYFSKQQQS